MTSYGVDISPPRVGPIRGSNPQRLQPQLYAYIYIYMYVHSYYIYVYIHMYLPWYYLIEVTQKIVCVTEGFCGGLALDYQLGFPPCTIVRFLPRIQTGEYDWAT